MFIAVWYGFLELGFTLHRGDDIYLSAFLRGFKKMRKMLDIGPWHVIQRQFPASFLLFSFPSQGWCLCKTGCKGTQAHQTRSLLFPGLLPLLVHGSVDRMWQLPTTCPNRSRASWEMQGWSPRYRVICCFLAWDSPVTALGQKLQKIEKAPDSVPSVSAKDPWGQKGTFACVIRLCFSLIFKKYSVMNINTRILFFNIEI